jgi:hypothetical protein
MKRDTQLNNTQQIGSVVMLSVIMLNVLMLNALMLNVVNNPFMLSHYTECH